MIRMHEPDAMEMAKRIGVAYHAWRSGAVLTNRQETDLYLADRQAWRRYRESLIGRRALKAAA